MKILYLTLGIPDPPVVGPQIRDFELYSRIAARHEVQIIALTETSPQASPREDRVGRVHPVVVPTALQPALLTRLPGHISAGRPLATLPFVTETALARLNTLQPPLPSPQGHGLFFVGNLAYGPNVDAVRYFCESVLPTVQQSLPDATFTAVGFDPPQSLFELDRIKGVSIVDSARDLRPYYQDAADLVYRVEDGRVQQVDS